MLKQLGFLRNVELRNVWPREAMDFTPWLAEHINELGETLGMDLEIIRREAAVGDFSLDLLARDTGRDRTVIIENQFGRTDHDHFGKLLTYAAGHDAKAIIWIAEHVREEHRQAIDWLNQHTDDETEFYAVAIELLQIDASNPACNFKLLAFPNDWAKETKHSQPTSGKGEKYRAYFQQLIDELRDKHHFTAARMGQAQSWYAFGSGITGFSYGMSFATKGRLRVEVYIDHGDSVTNKRIFDELFQKRLEIEATFGQAFEWERLDGKQAARISLYRNGSIDDDVDILHAIKDWSVQNLLKLKTVFGPYFGKIKAGSDL